MTSTSSTCQFKSNFTMNDEKQECIKRKNSVGPNISNLEEMLYKTIQYAKNAYEEAISDNGAAAHTENTNKFIKEYKSSGKGNDIDCNDEITTLIKLCNELFQADKNPTDNTMKDTIYTALSDEHPDEIKKIESIKDEWLKY
ncbi:3237_t:CDS:2 [Funneliformis geosporum]|nr:3237_t:CDS:2 [Funneliformis geosporum]